MNSRPLMTAAKCFGGWSLAVFFVTLLSFIFSFLGTIFCAVLAGMMLGATRQARVLALPTSVIFPGVIFALLRGTKADLTSGQEVGLAVACFGAFWLTFGVAAALASSERKGAESRVSGTVIASVKASTQPAGTVPRAAGSSLADLQGRWLEEVPSTVPAARKVLEIKRGQLELSLVGGDGQPRLLAKGEVRLDRLD